MVWKTRAVFMLWCAFAWNQGQMRKFQPTLLIIGDFKETLIVVRSLGRAGCKLIVGKPASQEVGFAQHSRFTSEVWRHPDFDKEEQFISALAAFLRSRHDIQYVLPVGDGPVACFAG